MYVNLPSSSIQLVLPHIRCQQKLFVLTLFYYLQELIWIPLVVQLQLHVVRALVHELYLHLLLLLFAVIISLTFLTFFAFLFFFFFQNVLIMDLRIVVWVMGLQVQLVAVRLVGTVLVLGLQTAVALPNVGDSSFLFQCCMCKVITSTFLRKKWTQLLRSWYAGWWLSLSWSELLLFDSSKLMDHMTRLMYADPWVLLIWPWTLYWSNLSNNIYLNNMSSSFHLLSHEFLAWLIHFWLLLLSTFHQILFPLKSVGSYIFDIVPIKARFNCWDHLFVQDCLQPLLHVAVVWFRLKV